MYIDLLSDIFPPIPRLQSFHSSTAITLSNWDNCSGLYSELEIFLFLSDVISCLLSQIVSCQQTQWTTCPFVLIRLLRRNLPKLPLLPLGPTDFTLRANSELHTQCLSPGTMRQTRTTSSFSPGLLTALVLGMNHTHASGACCRKATTFPLWSSCAEGLKKGGKLPGPEREPLRLCRSYPSLAHSSSFCC